MEIKIDGWSRYRIQSQMHIRCGDCRRHRSQADLLTPPDVEAPLPVCTGCKPDIAERLAQAETAAQNARHGRKMRTST